MVSTRKVAQDQDPYRQTVVDRFGGLILLASESKVEFHPSRHGDLSFSTEPKGDFQTAPILIGTAPTCARERSACLLDLNSSTTLEHAGFPPDVMRAIRGMIKKQ
jgi:hypothetical protein